jgi:hypothetical protein
VTFDPSPSFEARGNLSPSSNIQPITTHHPFPNPVFSLLHSNLESERLKAEMRDSFTSEALPLGTEIVIS